MIQEKDALEPTTAERQGRLTQEAREERFAWLMISPSLILLLGVATLPLLFLIVMSFLQLELTSTDPMGWTGLANYRQLLTDSRFWDALRVTLIYTISTVTLQVVIGLGLALIFWRNFRGEGVLRVAILLPMLLAPVVVGMAWRTMILTPDYGILDYFVQVLGFGTQPWLTDPTFALVSVIAIHTWQWTPFAFLVFLASLFALPTDPLEAAQIDRANAWQRFRHVMLPMLRPAIMVVIILRSIIALRAFAAIFSATGGGPGSATEILNLYAYRMAFNSLDLGYGATLATVLLLFTGFTSWIFFRLRMQG